MKQLIFYISLILVFSSCEETKTIYVASQTKNCEGVAPQKCLLIKENPDDKWTYFYDRIEGFTYEEGYNYSIKVVISKIKNPPADGSSLKYTLVKIISKEKDKTIAQNTDNIELDDARITYEALSRGYFVAVSVDNEVIKMFKDRNKEEFSSGSCSKEDWNTIVDFLQNIQIDSISKLKAPSDKRTFDGAAHAQLKIITGDKTYTSAGFDHGNPPEEIRLLVNHILSLAETVD